MQNWLKIRSSKSSVVVLPTISPTALTAMRRSMAANSRVWPARKASTVCSVAARARSRASLWRELIITSSIAAWISPDQTSSLMASLRASIPCPVRQDTSIRRALGTGGNSSHAGRSILLRTRMRFLAANSAKYVSSSGVSNFLNSISGGSGNGGDDGTVAAKELVEQTGFAGVGPPDDGRTNTAAQDLSFVGGAQQLVHESNSSLEAAQELILGVRGDVLLGKINVRFNVRQDSDHLIAQQVDALGELAR